MDEVVAVVAEQHDRALGGRLGQVLDAVHDRLEHALQRHPVGDEGQDVALGGEQALGPHALRDVLEDEHAADDLARLVAHRGGADADHDRAPVPADVEHVLVLDDLAREHRQGQGALVAFEALALEREELVVVVVARLVGEDPVTEDLGRLAVGEDDAARRRLGQHHSRRHLLDGLLQTPLLGAELGGRFAAQGGQVEVGAHAGEQFATGERLGQVVVGARLQPLDGGLLAGPRGEQDDRQVLGLRRGAHRLEHLVAVDARASSRRQMSRSGGRSRDDAQRLVAVADGLDLELRGQQRASGSAAGPGCHRRRARAGAVGGGRTGGRELTGREPVARRLDPAQRLLDEQCRRSSAAGSMLSAYT